MCGTFDQQWVISRIYTISKKKATSQTNGQEIRSDTSPNRISKLPYKHISIDADHKETTSIHLAEWLTLTRLTIPNKC